jgi:hypothetical protein
VVGGLVSATVLTLIVLPTMYKWIEEHTIRRVERRAAGRVEHEVVLQEV